MSGVSFTVLGAAAPQGSKRHLGNGVMVESSKRVRPWRSDVRDAAWLVCERSPHFWGDPVAVDLTFRYRRPSSHLNTKGEPNAAGRRAPYPTRPDVDKLCRAVLDACTGIVWGDDRQVVELHARREWGERDEACVEVRAA